MDSGKSDSCSGAQLLLLSPLLPLTLPLRRPLLARWSMCRSSTSSVGPAPLGKSLARSPSDDDDDDDDDVFDGLDSCRAACM